MALYIVDKALAYKILSNVISLQQQLKITRFLLIYIPCLYVLIVLIKSYCIYGNPYVLHLPNINFVNDIKLQAPSSLKTINQIIIQDYFYTLLFISILLLFMGRVTYLIFQQLKLRQLIKNCFLYKKNNFVNVYISDKTKIPFCFSLLKTSYIILTNNMLANDRNFSLALKHEIQHIRQRDTVWIYVFELFKAVFYLNPIAHLIFKHNVELQEFVCDEALIHKKSISSHHYANCLFEIAKHDLNKDALYVSTAVGFFYYKKSFTKRRIFMLFEYKKNKSNRKWAYFISVFLSLFIATTAYAVEITAAQPQKVLTKPLYSNQYILKWSAEAVIKSFSYDYINYKTNLENTSNYFTSHGWDNFMKALKMSGNIDAVITRKLSISAVVTGNPTVIQQGIQTNEYEWKAKIPVQISIMKNNQIINQNMQCVNLTIIRTNKTPSGIGISQYVVMPCTSN